MERVAVVGGSGSGKSTMAARLADRIEAEHIELDELYHRPNWEPTPTPEFRARVAASLDAPRWVVAGNYPMTADIVQGRADTIVWLDLPRRLTTWRVLRRSVLRAARREELWNGNREHWRDLVSRDPERNINVWAWTKHDAQRRRYEGFAAGAFWAHAEVHRLRTRRDVRRFLADHPHR